MKELSIEQKAKRYDEALEKSKRLYEQGTITESLCYVFPELKENEDEKVRKALIEMIHDTTGDSLWVDYNVHKEDALAWLEKQGEKDAMETQSEEYNDNIITRDDEILQAISIGLTNVAEELGWSDFGGLPIEEIFAWLEVSSAIDKLKNID